MWFRSLTWAVLGLLWLSGVTETQVVAAQRTWIGGDNDWVDGGSTANWNPADEPDSDDEAIFNTSNSVNLGSNNSILALTLSNGIDLLTNDNDLAVNGLVQLSGSSTNLFVGGAASTLSADDVTINSDGTVELTGGTLTVADSDLFANGFLTINTGGTLSGNGTVNLDSPIVNGTMLNNNGTLTALSRPENILLPPPIGTLVINGGTLAWIDLDGTGEGGEVNVNRNQTLDNNVTPADAFNGSMNLFQNSTLDIASAWTLAAGGTINVNNGAVGGFPGIPAGTSTIAGGTLTQTGGTISVVDADGTLEFTAAFTMNGGSFPNNGLVVFDSNATIGAGANVTMPTSNSSITVGAGRTVTVNQTAFNADGNGSATNVLTVNSGGLLNLNLGSGSDESLTGLIVLDSGTLHVTTVDDTWAIDGDVEVEANTLSQISGEALTMSSVGTTIAADATLRIAAPLTVGAGATFTGTGTLAFNDQVNVNAATTLNMVGGTVDLDGVDAVGDVVTLQAPLVINASTMSSFGRTNVGGGVNVIQIDALSAGATGSLTVNLDDPNAEWTLNPQGAIAVVSTNALLTLLAGSDVNLNGSVTVTGTAGSAARIDIGGTMNLQTAAPSGGFMLQGGSLADPNMLEGGDINGPGELQAVSGRALVGHGTIAAPIDFDGTAELVADGGLLELNGPVEDVGTIRVHDLPALLDFGVAFNTGVTDGGIVMTGGTIQGAAVTTALIEKSIRGTGTVTSPVINSGAIEAQGGTLQVNNPASDWDGDNNAGHLRATGGGSLELTDGVFPAFTGTVMAVEGSRVLLNGFDFHFDPGSSLILGDSEFQSTNTTDLGGVVFVNAGAESTIEVQVNRFLDFESTSSTTLNGDLRLINNNTTIEAGATFSGTGALVIPDNSHLVADPGADVDILLDLQGTFRPAGFNTVGRVDLRDYQQSETGELIVELSGTSLNQFDRLVVDGDVLLDGLLDVDMDGGFVPVPGNAFNIISANNVAGTFDQVQTSGMPAGLFIEVHYMPTFVQLVVVGSPPGDFDFDFDVDLDDWFMFALCLTGPDVPGPPPGCSPAEFAIADVDGDDDADLEDFGGIQGCFSGEGVPADPACAD